MQEEIQTGTLNKILNKIIKPMLVQISEPEIILHLKGRFDLGEMTKIFNLMDVQEI